LKAPRLLKSVLIHSTSTLSIPWHLIF
jgi:hypothetical protein